MKLRTLRPRHVFLAVVGAATLMGPAACANRVEPAPEAASQAEHARWRGPVSVVVDTALERGELSVEQHAAITAIGERASAEPTEKEATKARLRAAASQIVRSGTADSAQFDEAVDTVMSAIQDRMRVTSEALFEVHALLDASQRAAVADGLRDHLEHRYAEREQRAKKRGKLGKLAAHLMLTGVQLDELKKMRDELVVEKKDMRPTRGELEALVDAFEGDGFEAAVNAFHAEKLELMRGHLATAADRTDDVLSLLDDDQREVLAELIELGPKEAGLSAE